MVTHPGANWVQHSTVSADVPLRNYLLTYTLTYSTVSVIKTNVLPLNEIVRKISYAMIFIVLVDIFVSSLMFSYRKIVLVNKYMIWCY